MKKLIVSLLLAVVLLLNAAPGTLAQTVQAPIGGCPPGFELHQIEDHTDHEAHHIGTHQDRNGDGYLCVKHLDNGFHLHVDNRLPLR